jgi:hypothetical protein
MSAVVNDSRHVFTGDRRHDYTACKATAPARDGNRLSHVTGVSTQTFQTETNSHATAKAPSAAPMAELGMVTKTNEAPITAHKK